MSLSSRKTSSNAFLFSHPLSSFQAKKFVESTPAIVKSDLSRDEADKLKDAIAKVGGMVEIV